MDGEAVADRLTNTCEAEQREQREAMERSLTRDEERIEVLDKMIMRLYEDMIAGRISEQNFNTMLEKTQTEQTELKAKVSEGRKRLSDEVQLANDAKQWVEAIQEYANITELDAATLNRLALINRRWCLCREDTGQTERAYGMEKRRRRLLRQTLTALWRKQRPSCKEKS